MDSEVMVFFAAGAQQREYGAFNLIQSAVTSSSLLWDCDYNNESDFL